MMLHDLKHLGLPRRRARPAWILGIAAGVTLLGLISWMSLRDEAQRDQLTQLAAACPTTHLAGAAGAQP